MWWERRGGVKDDLELLVRGLRRRKSPFAVSRRKNLVSMCACFWGAAGAQFGGADVDMPIMYLRVEGRPWDTQVCTLVERSRLEV